LYLLPFGLDLLLLLFHLPFLLLLLLLLLCNPTSLELNSSKNLVGKSQPQSRQKSASFGHQQINCIGHGSYTTGVDIAVAAQPKHRHKRTGTSYFRKTQNTDQPNTLENPNLNKEHESGTTGSGLPTALIWQQPTSKATYHAIEVIFPTSGYGTINNSGTGKHPFYNNSIEYIWLHTWHPAVYPDLPSEIADHWSAYYNPDGASHSQLPPH
jgi:hypothetical protein